MCSTEVRNPYQALQHQNLACKPLVLLIYTAPSTAVRNAGDGAGLYGVSGCENPALLLVGDVCVVQIGDQSTGRKQGLARGLGNQEEVWCRWMLERFRPAPFFRNWRRPVVCRQDTRTVLCCAAKVWSTLKLPCRVLAWLCPDLKTHCKFEEKKIKSINQEVD